MNFKPADFLKEAIEERDIFKTRIALSTYINIDPSDRGTISSAKRYSRDRIIGLMEDHDGEVFNQDKENWTEEYLAEQQTKLLDNFSENRFLHILDIGEQLFEKDSSNTIYKQNHKKFRTKTKAFRKESSMERLIKNTKEIFDIK